MKETEENPMIVRKASIVETLRNIKPGVSVEFNCSELGQYICVASAASRLNKNAGYKKYSVVSANNGATYTVTHNA